MKRLELWIIFLLSNGLANSAPIIKRDVNSDIDTFWTLPQWPPTLPPTTPKTELPTIETTTHQSTTDEIIFTTPVTEFTTDSEIMTTPDERTTEQTNSDPETSTQYESTTEESKLTTTEFEFTTVFEEITTPNEEHTTENKTETEPSELTTTSYVTDENIETTSEQTSSDGPIQNRPIQIKHNNIGNIEILKTLLNINAQNQINQKNASVILKILSQ